MKGAVVDWLVQEARDLFQAGEIGLYEFIWELNGDPPRVSLDERIPHARAALDRILAEDDVVLVWHRWTDMSYEEQADPSALDGPGVWDNPTDAPYLAVLPRGDLGWGPELAAKQAAKAARSARLRQMFRGR